VVLSKTGYGPLIWVGVANYLRLRL